jgi:hypothetical protein
MQGYLPLQRCEFAYSEVMLGMVKRKQQPGDFEEKRPKMRQGEEGRGGGGGTSVYAGFCRAGRILLRLAGVTSGGTGSVTEPLRQQISFWDNFVIVPCDQRLVLMRLKAIPRTQNSTLYYILRNNSFTWCH